MNFLEVSAASQDRENQENQSNLLLKPWIIKVILVTQ